MRVPSRLRLTCSLAACLGGFGCAGDAIPPSETAPEPLAGASFVIGTPVGGGAQPEAGSIPFEMFGASFRHGDFIVIDEIVGSAGQWGIGDTLIVRGHYHLESLPGAVLRVHFYGDQSGAASGRTAKVQNGSGAFELSCEISYQGTPGVSFYPLYGGAAMG